MVVKAKRAKGKQAETRQDEGATTAVAAAGGQNANSLAKSVDPAKPNYKGMTDAELIEVANGGHRRFVGAMRKALVSHALIAGSALLQLKGRHEHGVWEKWLKANFDGSVSCARLYMRIARHWHLVVEHGLDKQGLTLNELQWILSESPGPRPGSEEAKAEAKKKKKEAKEAEGEAEAGQPEGEDVRQFSVLLDEEKVAELADMADALAERFGCDNKHLAIYEAVRREYEQYRDDREEVSDNA